MTNAPERIWIDDARTYSATFFSAGIPYVRADLFDALTAERDAALALVAAAYEAAEEKAEEYATKDFIDNGAAATYSATEAAEAIRTLTPADTLAAQAARDERMRAEGAREAEARIARLAAALKHLDRAATEVIRYGAQTGPQWTSITAASLKARAALRENGD